MSTTIALKPPLNTPADLYRNYATDERLADKALKYVTPMLQRARRNRTKMDERMRRRYNQWALVVDEKFYQGRANAYIPAVRKGIERLVTQWVRETFPSDEWWDCRATAAEFEKNVDGAKALLDTQLKRRIKLKRKARPYYRQLAIYGTSPLKYFWRYELGVEPKFVPGPQGPRLQKGTKVLYDDPDVKIVDFFSWGTYPETVADVDDAKLVYEDMLVDLQELKDDKQNYANLDKAKASAGSGSSGSTALIKRQERLRRLGITEDELNDSDFLFLTECYVNFDLRDGLGVAPTLLTLAWESVPVRLQRNAYERPPYRVGKDAELPEEFFGHPRTEATERLQIILNDSTNQDLDASAFANNPMVVVDPNYCEDYQAIALFPGAKIPAPPEAVKFDRPPDAAFSQKEKIAFLNQMILEQLGSPSGASPSPAASAQPRGARTFGGMQMLQMLAGSESKELVEFQEDLVWEPLLQDLAWLNARFMTNNRILRTVGAKGAPVTVNRETFLGDFAYDWLGTSTVQNQTVRSAQMLVAMNIVRNTPPSPAGYPNLGYIFKEYWRSQGLKFAERAWVEPPESLEPRLENEVILQGRAVEVSPRDNDAEHIVEHDAFLKSLPPGHPAADALVKHLLTHHQQQIAKQQAMLQMQAQMAQGPPPPTPMVRVDLKGNLDPNQTSRFAGGTGPAPNGARSGVKPSLTPSSGMGPAATMMRAPMGVPGGA